MPGGDLSFFWQDLLYVSADLLSGKSIPVLVAITRLPIDQFLMQFVFTLGAAAGAFYSAYAVRPCSLVAPPPRAVLWNRALQTGFSLLLSLSLLLSVARGIHYERGVALSILPAFCLIAQTLPPRPATALLSLLLVAFLLPVCMAIQIEASGETHAGALPVMLRGLDPEALAEASPETEAEVVMRVLGRALQLFVLAFYACTQHAPLQPGHVSRDFLYKPRYALLVCFISAWARTVVWYLLSHFPDNAMHVMLENDLSRGRWDWGACICLTVILLYAAVWAASLLREQLPALSSSSHDKLKLSVVALALAAFYRQRDAQILFVSTSVCAGLSILATALTLQPLVY